MLINIQGVNSKTGLDLYENDVDVYKSVLRFFISNIPAVLEKIKNVSSETLPDYLIKIHALKGSYGCIGAQELMDESIRLEAMAKKSDLAGILAENDALLEKTTVLVDEIRNWLKQAEAQS
jgi:HPt (histidine-containing phosphotransfer) domain-containing protein